MNLQEALAQADVKPLDAEVLLAHVLQKNREWLIAHGTDELLPQDYEVFRELVARRTAHEPVAYLTGTKEFYGRDFTVTPDTLIPRPATEHLVDVALSTLTTDTGQFIDADTDVVAGSVLWKDASNVRTIIDIGTGTGCIAITLKLERPELTVIATDVSEAAVVVARRNATQLKADVDYRVGNLLEPIADVAQPFVIVSNPPYIPTTEQLEPNVVEHEPHSALFAGHDGMALLRTLVAEAKQHPHCHGICLECKAEQWQKLW